MSTVIDLGKLRFLFRGDYNNGTSYELNDVVTYGGNSYTYINVTAGAGTNPDSTSHWSLMTRGITLRGDWDAATQYVAGDIAKLNGIHSNVRLLQQIIFLLIPRIGKNLYKVLITLATGVQQLSTAKTISPYKMVLIIFVLLLT